MNSMTGYGMGEVSSESITCKVEMRSVNNRYCDIQVRMPKSMLALEDGFRKEIKKYISRGKVDVYISYEILSETHNELLPDIYLVEKYLESVKQLKNLYVIDGELDINTIVNLPGVFQLRSNSLDIEKIKDPFHEALKIAIEEFLFMRAEEGTHLLDDFQNKLGNLKTCLTFLDKNAERILEENKAQFLDRFHSMVEDDLVDQARLTTELAIMSDKLSIDEEITRISSHILKFNDIMLKKEPVGRKLDFLLQELNREVNTIGSKTNDLSVADTVVEMKAIIEQLREQVQNIE